VAGQGAGLRRAMPGPSPFKGVKTSPEIIRLAVMLRVRFPLSLRNVAVMGRTNREGFEPVCQHPSASRKTRVTGPCGRMAPPALRPDIDGVV